MKLNQAQRGFAADKLMDSANYALAGLVLGQLVAKEGSVHLLSLGLFIYSLGWVVSLRMRKEVTTK